MTDTTKLGLSEAASRLGVPVRVLRRAIRAGKIPGPAKLTAVSSLSADWLATAQATAKATPSVLSRTVAQKVPAFARYEGTSAWRKYTKRVKEFAAFQAAN